MAANLGSSMFLYQGLQTISPYLLTSAQLSPTSSTRSLSPTTSENSFEMGIPPSTSKSRRSWFSSPPKPAQPACESFLLELRCTTCARRGVSPCTTESDYNFGGGRYAFLDHREGGIGKAAKFKYACNMEERVLEVDLCDFANYVQVARTKEVLKMHMGDPYMAAEQGNELRPVDVGALVCALRREGVRVQEPRRW
ncbi:hypothetical protein OQA88_1190 [Cercophora sp. LCS_1]